MDELAKPKVEVAAAPDAPVSTESRPAKAGENIDVDNYMMYSLDHDVPFVADYYGVGNMMNFKDLSYKAEVDAIDNYLVDEVRSKRLENSTEAVKSRLKQLEKIAGIDKNAPTSIRVKQLAAYSEYMKKLSSIGHAVEL